jgi:hypothetical protein
MGEISRYTPRCPMQNYFLKPRYPVADEHGHVDIHAFPNRCIRCVNDEWNWNCQPYNDFMKNKSSEPEKEAVIIPMVPETTPEEYRKTLGA